MFQQGVGWPSHGYHILFQVESYFDQAFVKEDEIGAGDFGRVFRVRSRVSFIMYNF